RQQHDGRGELESAKIHCQRGHGPAHLEFNDSAQFSGIDRAARCCQILIYFEAVIRLRAHVVFHVILYQPEIPPNTGNIIRLCANSGAQLHLIAPLGFDIDEKSVRRAGLDYALMAEVKLWDDFDACVAALAPPRWFAISTRGSARYDRVRYQ